LSDDLSQIPAIFGMNFQAVSVAQKDANGGINLLPNGQEGAPNTVLEGAMEHTDESIGRRPAGAGAISRVLVTSGSFHSPCVSISDNRWDSWGTQCAGTRVAMCLACASGPARTVERKNVALLTSAAGS
jgi:hypothetical protein